MPLVEPFLLDVWMQQQRPKSKVALHDSCVSPLSLAALAKLANPEGTVDDLFAKESPLSYGPIRGSPRLRSSIAKLYDSPSCSADDVLVTSGAILANFLILDTLLKAGDHVVVQYPTYGQLFQIPKRCGAAVSLWRMREDDNWSLDIKELEKIAQVGKTKLIILNNPTNPTGVSLSTELLTQVVEVAKKCNALLLCDEVFRPLFHTSGPMPASILSLGYDKVIVTGSMSKAYALPGIRLGWIAVHSSLRDDTLQRLLEARDYTSIAVSQLDDQVAAFALEPETREKILKRSLAIPQRNIPTLAAFVKKFEKNVSWIMPNAAGTCAIKISYENGDPVDDKAFADALVTERGLLIPPVGYCFGTEGKGDLKGYLRVGTVIEPDILERGLEILGEFLPEYLSRN